MLEHLFLLKLRPALSASVSHDTHVNMKYKLLTPVTRIAPASARALSAACWRSAGVDASEGAGHVATRRSGDRDHCDVICYILRDNREDSMCDWQRKLSEQHLQQLGAAHTYVVVQTAKMELLNMHVLCLLPARRSSHCDTCRRKHISASVSASAGINAYSASLDVVYIYIYIIHIYMYCLLTDIHVYTCTGL